MFQILQSVQVTNKEHSRVGEAGAVWAIDPSKPEIVGVRFDTDDAIAAVDVSDLKAL